MDQKQRQKSKLPDLKSECQPAKRKHDEETSSSESDDDGNDDIKWVEEDSESEPDLECDIWDDDCYTVIRENRKNAVLGYNLGKGIMVDTPIPQTPPSKQIPVALNSSLTDSTFKSDFQKSWTSNTPLAVEPVDFFIDPFKFCSIDGFLENVTVLDKIRMEMNGIKWNRRHMDLYEFYQSSDLKYLESTYVRKMYEFLKTDVQNWIGELCGLELVHTSATCSFYSDTDYLLVHDDLQEDRAIAFVLYMTDPNPDKTGELWTEEMGGALELLDKDQNGHPRHTVKKVFPKNNRFIFFQVSSESYHQVTEVLNMDHCRLSINGWFHTKHKNPCKAPELLPPIEGIFGTKYLNPTDVRIHLTTWISPEYLNKNTRLDIQKQIENESEVSLTDFFVKEKYEDLFEAITNSDISWEWAGPSNRRKYETVCIDNIPSIVSEFLNLFQSKEMFSLLRDYTELDLIEMGNMKPSMRMELQRWTPGCYSLLSEYDWENEKELDVIMYLGSNNIVGGQTMYIAAEENIEDAIITLESMDNTLNIVFRDTAKVTKHVSRRSQNHCFYILVCSYKE